MSLTIITGLRVFSSLAERQKIVLNIFTAKSGSFSLIFAIKNICFLFDLVSNKARKLKVAELNQAKASLTKPWLDTDEANHSLAV